MPLVPICNGTNRQIVYARPSGVNICSLQIEHRSAASFSIGAIGTNGSIGEDFLTIGICLCVLDMCGNLIPQAQDDIEEPQSNFDFQVVLFNFLILLRHQLEGSCEIFKP